MEDRRWSQIHGMTEDIQVEQCIASRLERILMPIIDKIDQEEFKFKSKARTTERLGI
jgi:hypothetical protein